MVVGCGLRTLALGRRTRDNARLWCGTRKSRERCWLGPFYSLTLSLAVLVAFGAVAYTWRQEILGVDWFLSVSTIGEIGNLPDWEFFILLERYLRDYYLLNLRSLKALLPGVSILETEYIYLLGKSLCSATGSGALRSGHGVPACEGCGRHSVRRRKESNAPAYAPR